ncbi:MAG: aromatic amino acid lyase, partial [Acidimicrobiales bacterium]
RTIERMRRILAGSYLFQPGAARNLQDPLTFRCAPQIHGAARDALAFTRTTVEVELNSSQGNPIVVLAQRRVQSAGNFDVGPLAGALDFARLALAPVVAAAAERTIKLLQAPLSGLAPGLAAAPASGDDGLAELAVAAQAIAVEARSLAHPVSGDLVSTSKGEGIEDRTTNAPLGARRLMEMTGLVARVVAIELVVAAQAVDLREAAPLGFVTRQAHAKVRELVPFTGRGETLPVDIEAVVDLVAGGGLARLGAGGQ